MDLAYRNLYIELFSKFLLIKGQQDSLCQVSVDVVSRVDVVLL